MLENDTQGSVDFSLNIVDIDGNLVTATPRFLTNPNIQVDTVMPSIESSYASSLNSVTVVFSENIHAESVSVDDFTMNNTDITNYTVSSNIVNLFHIHFGYFFSTECNSVWFRGRFGWK